MAQAREEVYRGVKAAVTGQGQSGSAHPFAFTGLPGMRLGSCSCVSGSMPHHVYKSINGDATPDSVMVRHH